MNVISGILSILLVIVFFGTMIFLHELGHFVVARLCHVRVLEFALGMGPKLFSRTSKKTGTVYSLRLLPIGGFCSMLGEDVGKDEEADANPEAFCNKPRYQRFFILIAGAAMNLLSAFLAMCLLLGINGTHVSNTVSGFYIPSYAGGLEVGDVITAVNETEVETEDELLEAIDRLKNDLVTFTVERDGKTLTLPEIGLPQKRVDGVFYRCADFYVSGKDGEVETRVEGYYAASAAAGLKSGDTVTHVNDTAVSVYSDISWEILLAADTPTSLTVQRPNGDGSTETVVIEDIVFPVSSESGVLVGSVDFGFEQQPFNGAWDFLSTAFRECVSTGKIVYRSLIQLIAGRFGTAGISGPIGVAGTISEYVSYGLEPMIQLFALISINLGLFNLLPLPALDGGRLIFVILEMIRRKPLNPKYETAIHAVGMLLLLALSALIAVFDIIKLIGG